MNTDRSERYVIKYEKDSIINLRLYLSYYYFQYIEQKCYGLDKRKTRGVILKNKFL